MTISFFHFPQQLFTYMWACLPPAPTQPQCVCGHMSPLWASHSQELSAPDALKTLELGESWSPHVSCTVSEDSAIHPFQTEPALCGKEGRKIVFVYQMLQHHLHKMYLSFNSVRSCECSHKNGILSCLDGTMYYLHLIFGFFHYKQDFLQWYSWAGKKKYGDKKKNLWRDRISVFTCTAWTATFVLINPEQVLDLFIVSSFIVLSVPLPALCVAACI